jgi:uncharacterized lipoprotein YddW (UPF0748 family)
MPLEPPPSVPREFRAAWATPIWDRGFRDWPSVPGLTPDSQRAELRSLLDHASSIGLNAVLLHVRLAGDALYPTPYAPWSAFLTGTSGEGPSPSYDPLKYAIDEAHSRGLQLHAWFNPFRAMLPNFAGKAAKSHVTRAHPDWVRKYGSQTWIDPGNPAARKWVLETMLDVVKRYDVDGIHIDDYFYPYRESRTVVRRVKGRRMRQRVDLEFPDESTWRRYGRPEGFSSRDAWRRANIDDFVQSLYRGVKAIKPSVLVGIAPFGIWRSGTPEGVRGLDAYDEIFADSKRWLTEGWLDYIAPQLYWPLDGVEDRFRALNTWWRKENPRDRYVWPAIYTSHVYGGRDPWPPAEIADEIQVLRQSSAATAAPPGHVHFRLAALFADRDRLATELSDMYRDRALVPAFPWLGNTPPAAPVIVVDSSITGASVGAARFSVVPGDSVRVRWWLIQTRGRDGVWMTTIRPSGEARLGAGAFGTDKPNEIAVTAIGLTGVASTATIIAP